MDNVINLLWYDIFENKQPNSVKSIMENLIGSLNEDIDLWDLNIETDTEDQSLLKVVDSNVVYKKPKDYIEEANESIKVSNPKKWYRKSNNLDVLKKLNSKLEKNNEYKVLDSFKWIQNIDSKDDSKFLFHENVVKEYGIFLKLYRSRFLHVDIKSYLGVASNKTNDTTDENIQKYESKILKSNQTNKINITNNLKLNLNEPNRYIDINQDKDDLKIESSEIINIFIDEERRIFNEEIHYFDHPKFGIILSVNDV